MSDQQSTAPEPKGQAAEGAKPHEAMPHDQYAAGSDPDAESAQEAEEPEDAIPESQESPAEAHAEVPARLRKPQAYEDSGVQWSPVRPPAPQWRLDIQPDPPAPIGPATLWAAFATAGLSALLLQEGIGVNLLIVAGAAAFTAAFAAHAAGRRIRPWTLVWAVGGLALLAVPALRDAGWPAFLALLAALALGSLALHGGRTWRGALLGSVGVLGALVPGGRWAWQGLRERADGTRDRWWPVVRTAGVAAALLVVFGALFAGADAAFADLLGGLAPDVTIGDSPVRAFFFLLGLFGALAAARTAAAPLRWDRIKGRPGRPRGRIEWALPLVVLNALFAAFIAVQLAVLFGGYDKVLSETGLTYAQYARQGFWQLLWATLLTLVVIAVALRLAPRGGQRDRTLVRAVLGTLCALTLVVVASALRRMDLYVDAYGLTRLRISVAGVEFWLGLVIVLIMVAGVAGGRWLPRAVVGSAAAAVLAFGLLSPDGLVAEQNIERYERTGKIDLEYLQDLSADAVPALDGLPEPERSCALRDIDRNLQSADEPWYATSLGEHRARAILRDRPLAGTDSCDRAGLYGGEREAY
ncbi:DUF4153 domain-containing protein [Streptomyces sp. 7N604]|uniref:DUF4153 domain-containing protein n=1 Tax=Streptomyces sp. 7N604 TaxID=3457415 RepID=UPI003FD1CC74